VLDALLHLDGEVRRHAEPRFLVEATLARLAVELGSTDAKQENGPPVSVPREVGASPVSEGVKEVPEPVEVDVVVAQGAPTAGGVAGWSEVLDKLNRTVRAAYLDAQPELDGSLLVLWFRYGFHHKKAQEQSTQLMPHVRAWLGDSVKVDFRLREGDTSRPTPKASSPEDDPFVREVVRRFDGRVTRVKEVTE
jgi:DNA polymerase III subunit tau-like protein